MEYGKQLPFENFNTILMLDQSFSAHNCETIYNLESHKGNINDNTMPENIVLS